ncbi:MAG: type II toxin-antitoxin system death-on-curing family toxin [Actinomycetes bacterium]
MSVRYLTAEHLLDLTDIVVDGRAMLRDPGLLDAAAHRPRAELYGQQAYPGLHDKAAALLHGIATSGPLLDGNKRLGWIAAVVFLWLNNGVVDAPEDDIVALMREVAEGSSDVFTIAAALHRWTVPLVPRQRNRD